MPTLHPVSSARDLAAFIALPRRLYRGIAGFVAPLDHERRQLLDPSRSSFHTHGESAYWIAPRGRARRRAHLGADRSSRRPGRCMRASASSAASMRSTTARWSPPFCGEARAWLAERARLIARGPFLLSINGESGLLLEGQDRPPMVLMAWHPPYLARHLEACRISARENLQLLRLHARRRRISRPTAGPGRGPTAGRLRHSRDEHDASQVRCRDRPSAVQRRPGLPIGASFRSRSRR